MPNWEGASNDPAYGKAAWKRARLRQLRADNWRCQIRGPKCLGAASEVDHIHGLAADPQHKHLRSVCRVCHRTVTAKQGNDAQRGKPANPSPRPRTVW